MPYDAAAAAAAVLLLLLLLVLLLLLLLLLLVLLNSRVLAYICTMRGAINTSQSKVHIIVLQQSHM